VIVLAVTDKLYFVMKLISILISLQALTTGTVPGFIDVVLNFDTSAMQDDNILSQLHSAGKRIVFYGDNTWIKMFPNLFERSDGTTSFFVTDYTEVVCFH